MFQVGPLYSVIQVQKHDILFVFQSGHVCCAYNQICGQALALSSDSNSRRLTSRTRSNVGSDSRTNSMANQGGG